ncbi:major facilitator superfamily domain-containing protein [Amanita rubescens]|nr:major facilitator superfamily domain-containing protein [Amanita rubescens]
MEVNKEDRTPLPWLQLSIIYLIQFAEPVTATVIYPFIIQFIQETGITKGDERRTGYFVGMIQSTFFFAEAFSVVPWGMASDRVGRRPLLILGPLGLSLAMLGFGMSTQFWTLLAFRILQGIFNGTIGVSKTVIGEVCILLVESGKIRVHPTQITDSTNMADAFAITPVVWTVAVTIGPFIGGLLSQPATRWPDTFGRISYLRSHPYFLPSFASSILALLIFLMALIALKETLPSKQKRKRRDKLSSSPTARGVPQIELLPRDYSEPQSPQSLLKLADIRVVLVNYAFIGFCDMSVQMLTPLMWSTSIEHGGLGFSPYAIGMSMGIYGAFSAILQVIFLGRIIRKLSPRRMHIACFSSLLISYLSFPVASFFARRANGADWKVWFMVIVSLSAQSMRAGAYGSLQIIITEIAPSRSSLGTLNGMGQATASTMRSLGPSFASSLYSISLEQQLAGGNAVYYIMTLIVAFGIRFTLMLPKASHPA